MAAGGGVRAGDEGTVGAAGGGVSSAGTGEGAGERLSTVAAGGGIGGGDESTVGAAGGGVSGAGAESEGRGDSNGGKELHLLFINYKKV